MEFPGAEAVLLLRAMISDNHFEEYWAYHCAREIEGIRGGGRQHDYRLTA